MIETSLNRVCKDRHFRTEAFQQRTLGPETSDLYVESGRIQAISNVNELLFRTADIEVVQEFQDSDAIRICAHV